MTPETPLAEVARLLPTEAATLLMDQSPPVQKLAVELLKGQILYWESRGVLLDPLQFDVVVTGLVVYVITVHVPHLLERVQRHGAT